MNIVKASAKSVRISPRKVGVVAALVRNRTVEDALTILENTPRGAALPVKKVIESAKANAENNHSLQVSSLKLSSITVTPGPRMKRYRPAAHGRALPFERKSSHIFVEIAGEPKPVKKPATKAKTTKSEEKSGGKK